MGNATCAIAGLSLDDLRQLLLIISEHASHIAKAFGKAFVAGVLVDAVLGRMRVLSSEEVRAGELTLLVTDNLYNILDEMVPKVNRAFPVDEALELHQLDRAESFMRCPYMQQRLQGVQLLTEMLDLAKKKDNYGYQSHSHRSSGGSATRTMWLTQTHAAKWLGEHNIVALFFGQEERADGGGNGGGNGGREGIGESKTTANGAAAVGDDGDSKENPPPQASQAQQDSAGGNGIGGGGQLPSDAHPEIIQRSKPILKMLAKKGKLTARDIDTVWGTAERAGSHASSLMGAVYVEVERLVMGRRD